MTTGIDDTRRTAARVAGAAYLVTFAVVVFANFGIFEPLIAGGDAAATARHVLAAETRLRLGVVCDLVYCAGVVTLIGALYALLAGVDRLVALLAAGWRLLFVVMWGLSTQRNLEALRLLHAPPYLRALDPAQQQALARFWIFTRADAYYGGLLFFALAATAVAWLLLRSGFFPRWLASLGVVASAWCAVCAVAYVVDPGFAKVVNLWWFDSPMGLFELAAGVWLLARPPRLRPL